MENQEIINTTLLLIVKDNKILLGKKKRGFASGKYNGFGGKQIDGETIDETMLRETKEEAGIVPLNWKRRGEIIYDEAFMNGRKTVSMVLYSATDYQGEIKESDEMQPAWFDLDKIPYSEMIGDDIYWYPTFLEGKNFNAWLKFDDNFNVIEHKVEEVF